MRERLKRAFFWSSVGGVALGAAVALLGKMARKPAASPLVYEKIPPGCKRISLRTERFEIAVAGKLSVAHDEYQLRVTPFKVWSFLNFPSLGNKAPQEGVPVYHATVIRHLEPANGENGREEAQIQDRFYGTVFASGGPGEPDLIARGAFLEFRKCSVGGTSNAIETGEAHRSAGPVLNYRFEYTYPPTD
jgi:hypothetical protein